MTLTKLSEAKKTAGRIHLYIDGEYAITLPLSLVVDFSLKAGMDISDELYLKLKEAERESKARKKALDLLSYRGHSKKELEKKLVSRDFTKEEARAAASYAESLNYIDDAQFARDYALSLARKNKSNRIIALELSQKGISEEEISEAQDGLSDETERARALILKKIGQKHLDFPQKEKIKAALYRQGFGLNTINAAFSSIESDE